MDQIVLITGASSGMGRETAIFLARNGYKVYAGARRLEKMEDLKEDSIRAIALDVTVESSCKEAVEKILLEQGRIDVLINNAGYGVYGAVEDVPLPEAQRQLDVNLFGAARMIQLVLPSMRNQKSGFIVNVTSIGGKFATPFGGWYHASKFGLEGLSDSLRNEVRQFGVKIVVVEPGGVQTEFASLAFDSIVATSGKGAYRAMVERMVSRVSSTNEHSSPALVIAELIHKILRTKNPKTRYAAGFLAKSALFLRKTLSDRMMDRLILSQIS
jgi:short-subunit dehydrogenase